MKILYIEGNPAHIELTGRSLEILEPGIDLQTAPSIQKAFPRLATIEYDLILSNYHLPDGSGLDVIKMAREQGVMAAIILVMSQDDCNFIDSALAAGAADCIVLQDNFQQKLAEAVQTAWAQTRLEVQKAELYKSKKRYRNIFENAVEGIFQSTLDGKFLSVNPAMAKIYGYDSSEDMLNSITDISTQIHASPDSRTKFLDALTTQGSAYKFEAQNRRKDGSLIWTSTNARSVKNEKDEVMYFEGFVTDITERKQAEGTLFEAEERYRTLVENLPAVVFIDKFDEVQPTQYISPRIKDLLGYTPEEWKTTENLWEQSLHPDDRERVIAEDIRTNNSGEPFRAEYRLRHADGKYIWVREDSSVIKGEDGSPLFWQGFLLDVTDQKTAEEAIRENEGSYLELFNSVTQAIYIQDKNGRFLDVNNGAVNMYNYPREFFIGKTPEILSAPGKNKLDDLIRMTELAFAGKPQEFEFWGLRSNGQVFPKIVTLTKGTYFGQDVIIAIAQDITERKQAEEILERQLMELMTLHAASMAGAQSSTEDEIIEQTIQATARIFPDLCGVLLLNDQGDMLLPHPSSVGPNMGNWQVGYSIARGITGRAVTTGRTMRIADITKDPDYIEVADGIKSELCVPFSVHGRIIGVFDVESRQENAFDEKDERLLNTLAAGLGTAIEKLRLFKAERAQSQREAAILELMRSAASMLDLNQVLQSVIGQIVKVIPSDSGTIQILEGDQLHILAASGKEAVAFSAHSPLKLSQFPINNYVIKENKTVRIENTLSDQRFLTITESQNIRSFMAIPLAANEKIIGMITLDSQQESRFTEQDEELGLAIASHASVLIENARLFELEQRRRRQAEVLRKTTEALTKSLELNKLFDIILDSLAELVPYDSASIEIIHQGYYQIVAGRNINENLVGQKYVIDPDKWGGMDAVRMPIIIEDVQVDERFEKFSGSEYIHGWMGIPLSSQDKLIGFLNFDSRKIGAFNQEHASIAHTFANQAAVAIDNARLFQEENRRSQIIEALANIANEIAPIREVIPALDKIAEHTLSLLNAGTVAFYLLQDDGRTIKIVSAQGAYKEEMLSHTLMLGEGITGNIIAAGKPEIVDDITKDTRKKTVPGTPEEDVHVDTMMSAPLILHDKCVGAINAWRLKSRGLFDKSELNFLVSIAHQASISIESVRLFQETIRRAQEATAIAEVGRDISATLQLDLVLERIALYAKNLLRGQSSAVYLSEADQPLLRAISAFGIDSDQIKNDPLEVGVGILGNIAKQKFGEIVNDTNGDPRAITIKGTDDDPYGHIMGVPVLSKDQLTGLLVVWRSGIGEEFQASDLDFLTSLAQQAAVAIENARLFGLELHRRLEAETVMRATNTLVNLLDIPSLQSAILDWLQRLTPYDSASILEIEDDQLRITAAKGLANPEKALEQTFPASNVLCQIINESGEPLIIGDCQDDPRFEKWGDADYVRGWMGIPLISRGRVIGYITMDSHTPHAFNQSDAITTQTFAYQAATALENARLFDEERKRRREAENLRVAATAITSSLNPQEVLETILTALKQVVPFDLGTMLLLEDDHIKIVAAHGFKNNKAMLDQVFPSKNQLLITIKQTHRPLILSDALSDPRYERWVGPDLIRGWLGVPLVVHGEVIGFITLGSHKYSAFDQNAANLAQTFALHAATAIDNTHLFENLQKSNQELVQAYDTTLAGWAKALELRDKETHGHTNRVTELTVDLARFMGISKADLVHLRRGVLLHDIGKMGVPNEILHKEGPLTDEEWVEMRKHPQYAFDLLYPITYLRPSLDIPFSHHEWWDGTGYPQKLNGEEIPLPARIFAVVDVWDALLSDRPYRKAWDETRVKNYLREQAGTHFDPQIVEIFLKMIETKALQEMEKTQPIKRVEK